MGAAVICAIMGFGFAGVIFVSVLVHVLQGRKRRAKALELTRALGRARKFRECSLRESELARVEGELGGGPCSAVVHERYEASADEQVRVLTLSLLVQVADLDPTALHELWAERLAPFSRRRSGRSATVEFDAEGFRIRGDGTALRDVFSHALPKADLADLFDTRGATPEDVEAATWKLGFYADGMVLLETWPEGHLLGELEPKLKTLRALATWRPGASQGVGPRTVGTQQVTVQVDQRCTFCHDGIAGASASALKTCAGCGVTLHASCLEEHGGCTTAGCRNDPRGRRRLNA